MDIPDITFPIQDLACDCWFDFENFSKFFSFLFGDHVIPFPLPTFLFYKQNNILHDFKHNISFILWSKVARIFAKQIQWF
jgi:hypothetical protein